LYLLTFASPLPSHSAQSPQTSDKCLSGPSLTGSLLLACITISSSPDELQALGLHLPLPFHIIQPRRATSTRLDFFFHLDTSLLPPLRSLPSQSAQTSDKRSSGISFYSTLRIHSLSPCTISSSPDMPDELQALVWAISYRVPPFGLPYHLIQPRRATSARLVILSIWTLPPPPFPHHPVQMSYKHSSGLLFSPQCFTSTSLTISISPDELQALVWLFFQHRLYLHLPYHLNQPRRVTSARLGFLFTQRSGFIPFRPLYDILRP
jgi:hypothetical protein